MAKTRATFAREVGKGMALAMPSESGLSGFSRRGGKGGSNSVVESQPSKLLVAGSIPVSRSSI